MSFRINNNQSAQGIQSQLDRVGAKLLQNTARLSSGLKINAFADDPSGYITGNALQSRISAIQTFSQNTQDAINMAKTTDAALAEIGRLLTQGRAIAVQAGNTATLSTTQVQALSDEANAILSSINRIATSTKWGTKSVLDGSAGVSTAITNAAALTSVSLAGKVGGDTLVNGLVTLTQTATAVAAQLNNNVTYSGANALVPAGTLTLNGITFTFDGTADTLQSVLTKLNDSAHRTGVVASLQGAPGSQTIRLDSLKSGSKFPIQLLDPNGILNTNPAPTPTTAGADAMATALIPTEGGIKTISFVGGRNAGDAGTLLTDSEGNILSLGIANGTAPLNSTGLPVAQISAGNQTNFQLGTEPSETIGLLLQDLRANKLATSSVAGKTLANVDLSAAGGPGEALTLFDEALTQVNSLRAQIGAFQGQTLESHKRKLAVLNENYTAAQSDIMDTDIASEMTEFTKNQVIQQSGVAILAQANAMPQQILRLLE